MVLADDIITELGSSWNTSVIAKPTLIAWHDKINDQKTANGWVKSGTETLEPDILGNQAFGMRSTPFEILIVAETETNYDKYKSEVERIIFAKSVTAGFWEISSYQDDQFSRTTKRFNLHVIGQQVKWT